MVKVDRTLLDTEGNGSVACEALAGLLSETAAILGKDLEKRWVEIGSDSGPEDVLDVATLSEEYPHHEEVSAWLRREGPRTGPRTPRPVRPCISTVPGHERH